MVLKCLNHIYRLSTDVMFFTWSPFVWMKINWWQMRKDSAKTSWGDLLDRSAPKWTFQTTNRVSKKPMWKSAHAPRELPRGLILLIGTSEIKWFLVNCLGLPLRKRSLLHIMKEAVWVRLSSSFSQAPTQPADTTIHHTPHHHYHH